MSSVGAPELVIILLVCVLIFGGSKLPKLARSIGEAKVEFEKSSSATTSTVAKDEQVTMTKAELDELLSAAEAKANARHAAGLTSNGGTTSAEDHPSG